MQYNSAVRHIERYRQTHRHTDEQTTVTLLRMRTGLNIANTTRNDGNKYISVV